MCCAGIDVLINSMVPTDAWFRVSGLSPTLCQLSLAARPRGPTHDRFSRLALCWLPLLNATGQMPGHSIACGLEHVRAACGLRRQGRRPEPRAPPQKRRWCSQAGYPGTAGTKLLNYVVSDRVISPPGLQSFYVEKVRT